MYIFFISFNIDLFLFFQFVLWIATDGEEGLYNFFFHNCAQGSSKRSVNFTVNMRTID